MKKKILAVFLLFTILLSGCGVATDDEVSGETVTFTKSIDLSKYYKDYYTYEFKVVVSDAAVYN